LPLFLVAPEIVDLFGGEAATRSLLAELYGTYPCAVCGKPGHLDPDHPAAVVVTLYDNGTGPLVVRLAHPTCSRSGVVLVVHAPIPSGNLTVPAMAWLRGGADPPSVVVIAPRVHTARIAAGGDLLDVLLSALLATGFRLLTDPHTPLPVLPGRLHIEFATGQRLRVTDTAGNTLYDGTLPTPDGWAELAAVTGLIGIVVVRGLDLHDHDRDHLADLFTAIRNGTAVGAAVPTGPNPIPERPARPALPPS
jgi:hypothetical protein